MTAGPASRAGVVAVLGTAQTLAWASSYYLPAILAAPMAAEFGVPASWVFGAFSAALVVSAFLGPWAGRAIDRRGGRPVLAASSLVFAVALALLAAAPSFPVLALGWLLLGIGMAVGLYEAAFSTLAHLYGREARASITGITLIAGFASTVGWPASALLLDAIGWRGACVAWAALHLLLGLPLNLLLPRRGPAPDETATTAGAAAALDAPPPRYAMPLLSFAFGTTVFVSAAMAAHLPGLIAAAGLPVAVAVTAGALIGPAQVVARVGEWTVRRRFHPLVAARLATLGHPLGAAVLLFLGGPAGAYALALLHGGGNGILTIAKGALPLAVFGPAGYGARQGWISAPARVLQAASPFLFGVALERLGADALAVTTGLSLSALFALLLLRTRRHA
ncbi:MFS transporter [Craurococcus roseus]|uniref:MFS transporter n=1 Tax=Craurococcus roseus TaxID=77585 RepID=A0ABN1FKM3_9PROT